MHIFIISRTGRKVGPKKAGEISVAGGIRMDGSVRITDKGGPHIQHLDCGDGKSRRHLAQQGEAVRRHAEEIQKKDSCLRVGLGAKLEQSCEIRLKNGFGEIPVVGADVEDDPIGGESRGEYIGRGSYPGVGVNQSFEGGPGEGAQAGLRAEEVAKQPRERQAGVGSPFPPFLPSAENTVTTGNGVADEFEERAWWGWRRTHARTAQEAKALKTEFRGPSIGLPAKKGFTAGRDLPKPEEGGHIGLLQEKRPPVRDPFAIRGPVALHDQTQPGHRRGAHPDFSASVQLERDAGPWKEAETLHTIREPKTFVSQMGVGGCNPAVIRCGDHATPQQEPMPQKMEGMEYPPLCGRAHQGDSSAWRLRRALSRPGSVSKARRNQARASSCLPSVR